ncbi:MAG: hypothetical protein ACLP05_03250 [Candidatus Kryptoniota bacterium]
MTVDFLALSIDKCPNCGKRLSNPPKRKAKCPFCKKDIFTRVIPESGIVVLVARSQLHSVEQSREEFYKMKGWWERLRFYGIGDAEKEISRDRLQQKVGGAPSDRDVAWSIFNELLAKDNSPQLCYEMALFIYEEGRIPFDLLTQHNKLTVQSISNPPFPNKVQILTGCCPECDKHEGEIMTISEALEKMPIPRRSCTHRIGNGPPGFCICIFALAM